MKKVFLTVILCLLLFCFLGCDPGDNESKPQNTEDSIIININDKKYTAQYNVAENSGDVVIYDREFINVDGGSISLAELCQSRKLYKVSVDENDIYTVKESVSESDAIIPVNGFILSFSDQQFELKYNTKITLENYKSLNYETDEFCTFTVNREKRRVYLKDPDVELDEDIIVLITSDFGKEYTLKEKESAYLLEKQVSGSYIIGEKIDGIIPKGSNALVFTGEYNIAFAEKFMLKDEKINFRNLASVNSSVYLPSVEISGSTYEIFVNSSINNDGIYLFDCSYDKYATPKIESDFVAVVVSNNKIIYVGEKNEQLVIPNNNGYVLVFVGEENIAIEKDNKKVTPVLVTPNKSKNSAVKLEYSTVSSVINGVDQTRETDNLIVYTPAFGKTTRTNEWGCEVAVDRNGTMIEYSSAGDMEIPVGGFVISAHGKMMTWLQENYLYGANVSFEQSKNRITISVTPHSAISSVQKEYEIVKSNYDNAISTYREFDFASIETLLNDAKSHLEKTSDDDLSVVVEAIFAADKALKDASNLYFSSSTVENRAVWYAPTEKSEAEVKKTIDVIKSLKINALYIETWHSGMTIYKTNLDMTCHEPRFGGFDVLEAFVRLGHENGIEIHAWVHDFFVGTDQYQNVRGHVLNLHPDWALETRSGSVYNPTEYGNFMFLDPYKRECRDFVLSVYREILENYDVDGLHLDYIRFPEPNGANDDWGYNDDIIAAFKAEYNVTVDPHTITSKHSLWNQWCKFRENIITSFVGEVYDMVQEVNPDIWLSAAIYPNMNVTPKIIFQNFVPWVENGWMDEIFAMSYASSADRVLEVSDNFLNAIKGKCFYSAGIGAFAGYDNIAYLEEVEQLRGTDAAGSNIFSLASVYGNELRKLFEETVYRNDCIQVYDVENAVNAYLQSMIERSDGVYTRSNLSENDLSELKKILSDALESVKKIELSDKSRASKKAYCESVKPIIEAIDFAKFNSIDSTLTSALNTQIDMLVKILNTNININS